MKQDEIQKNPFQTVDDQESMLHLGDTRKPKLTLRHLNKLRKMKELRRFEKLQQHDFLEIMYGVPKEDESPLG
jgi:hypothetical protein